MFTLFLTSTGPVSAFAFKAKQKPLEDVSNRIISDGSTVQAANGNDEGKSRHRKRPKLSQKLLATQRNDVTSDDTATTGQLPGSQGLPKHPLPTLNASDRALQIEGSESGEVVEDRESR